MKKLYYSFKTQLISTIAANYRKQGGIAKHVSSFNIAYMYQYDLKKLLTTLYNSYNVNTKTNG